MLQGKVKEAVKQNKDLDSEIIQMIAKIRSVEEHKHEEINLLDDRSFKVIVIDNQKTLLGHLKLLRDSKDNLS